MAPRELTTLNDNGGDQAAEVGASSSPQTKLVIVVDPYSTGCMIAQEISKRGYHLMALWTAGFSDEMKTHVPVSCADLRYHAELTQGDGASLEEMEMLARKAGEPYEIIGCVAGGEAGVDFADEFSEHLGVLSNGTDIANRRDKKVQQELVKAKGMRSVRQAGGSNFEEVREFLETETYPVVLKPVDSAGSDGVKLCETFEEAEEHFHHLLKVEAVNGGYNESVLCQEFLRGTEYVIDHVSRDGIHKTMVVWAYDKRPANGSAFVYYGMVPVDPQSPEAQVLIPYIRGVLDALGMKNGPSHGEAIMTADGPCLVEMNCRAHGGDGNWSPLARALTGGYSQIEATADAYLDPDRFFDNDVYPEAPPSPLRAAGLEVNLISFSRGKIKATPGFDVLQALPSFVWQSPAVKIGDEVDYTIDLISSPGCCILMNKDDAVLKKDLDFIRYLEEINGLFIYETRVQTLKKPSVYDSVSRQSSMDMDTLSPLKRTPSLMKGASADDDGHFKPLMRIMSLDRPELRGGPLIRRPTTIDAPNEAVVVVDPYSTGCWIVKEILNRQYKVIALWTAGFPTEMRAHIPLDCEGLNYHAHIEEGSSVVSTAIAVRKAAGQFRVVACLAGGEAGVGLADTLSETLEVRTNGVGVAGDRRDKKVQQELVAKAGMRSVRQAGGSKFEDVEDFLKKESYPVVVKPVDSAGSDGVKLCHDFDEAKDHFGAIMSEDNVNVNGGQCSAVLCQEFLRGKEYVVDHVSRNGVHKTMMVWSYDKRPANGSAFVYFGMLPVDPQSAEARLLIPYVRGVLDALDIKNGPTHAEVIVTPGGPCLVEMNCRAHGGDGTFRPLARALTGGYSQIETTVDAYLGAKEFDALPAEPPSPLKSAGQEVILVSRSRGTVTATPGFDVIRSLESFVYLESAVERGTMVDYTTDLFTGIGSTILMHPDREVLEADVATIRKMEENNELFEYEKVGAIFKAVSSLNLADMNVSTTAY